MDAERWRRIDELFRAVSQAEPGRRGALLAELAAGDEGLRREVEALLEASEEAGGFLDTKVFEAAAPLLAGPAHELKPGQVFGRYQIIKQLGAGGMGEVYLAEDTTLGRRVALKLLPSDFAADPDLVRRFQQEARAASRLNHPNILVIHEVGEAENLRFIVTEFVEGETLRELLARGPLPPGRALDMAAQLASALSAAHAAGIIHRDIKPENVILRRDGLVKVLDFGLVKLTPAGAAGVDTETTARTLLKTGVGVVLGTVSYMSPEQASGKEVDARTDLWSLGVVLYEMSAGGVPFEGETPAEVMARVIEREPVPLSRRAPEAPPELGRILTKALAKDREERYQTASDLLADLNSLKRRLEVEDEVERGGRSRPRYGTARATSSAEYVAGEIRRHKLAALAALLLFVAAAAGVVYYFRARGTGDGVESIAVLPFVNAGGDPEMEYLSDGITESLINGLSQLPNVRVLARGTAFRFKGREADPQAVGAQLGVDAVLTGRVVQRGDSLAIQADLVNVSDGSQMWGERYDRELTDLVALQSEIARDVSARLRARLSGADERRVTKHHTQNAEAYRLYLKGRFHLNKFSGDGYRKGVDYFTQAIAAEPNYAPAYAGLADCYFGLSDQYAPPREVMPKAREAALKAIRLDDTLAEAHTSLASVKMSHDWDWRGAEEEFRRAIALNPEHADAHFIYGRFLAFTGRSDEAVTELRRAQQFDPLSPVVATMLGVTVANAGQPERGVEQIKQALDLEPSFAAAHGYLGLVYQQQGELTKAVEELETATRLSNNPRWLAGLGYAYAVTGREEEARRVLRELQERARSQYVSSFFVAVVYAGLGEKDQAFAWLDRACEERADALAGIKVLLWMDDLRPDPRFQELLRRVGLPQ